MGIIDPALAVEIDLGVSPAAGGWLLVLGPEALVRGPGFDQCAVDAEMFLRNQVLAPRLLDHGQHEPAGDIDFDQAIPVLAEGRVVPHRVVQVHADEPTE